MVDHRWVRPIFEGFGSRLVVIECGHTRRRRGTRGSHHLGSHDGDDLTILDHRRPTHWSICAERSDVDRRQLESICAVERVLIGLEDSRQKSRVVANRHVFCSHSVGTSVEKSLVSIHRPLARHILAYDRDG